MRSFLLYSFLLHIVIFSLFLVLTQTLADPGGNEIVYAKYDEVCDAETKCDAGLGLKCKDGICACALPDTMIYLNSTGKCHQIAGEQCTLMDSSAGKLSFSMAIKEVFDCVPNGKCAWNGKCECDKHFAGTEQGTCESKRSYHEPCSNSSQCRDDLGLHCWKDQCVCDRSKHLGYNWERKQCNTLAGYYPTMEFNQTCIQNAYSTYHYSDNNCKCFNNFTKTSVGHCVVSYNKSCDPSIGKICSRDMICLNGECQCAFSGQRYVNGTCISLASQPCHVARKNEFWEMYLPDDYFGLTEKDHEFHCTPYAECRARQDAKNVFECQCNEDYEEVNGECHLKYGSYCGRASDKTVCDKSRNLQCIDNRCICAENALHYFDSELQTCMGLVGASCGKSYIFAGDPNHFCTDGAVCLQGTCKCAKEHQMNSDRKCEKIQQTNFRAEVEVAVAEEPLVSHDNFPQKAIFGGGAFPNLFQGKNLTNWAENKWNKFSNWTDKKFDKFSNWTDKRFDKFSKWGDKKWNKFSNWTDLKFNKFAKWADNKLNKFANWTEWTEFQNGTIWNEFLNSTEWKQFQNLTEFSDFSNMTSWNEFANQTGWSTFFNFTEWNEYQNWTQIDISNGSAREKVDVEVLSSTEDYFSSTTSDDSSSSTSDDFLSSTSDYFSNSLSDESSSTSDDFLSSTSDDFLSSTSDDFASSTDSTEYFSSSDGNDFSDGTTEDSYVGSSTAS